MRIAMWNCCRASRTNTRSAVAALGASVVVLQEARRPPDEHDGEIWLGPNPRNGLEAIPGSGWRVTLGPTESTAPWSVAPLVIDGPIQLHLLMVWTRKEHGYLIGLDAALTAYADFLTSAPAIVLGDFNSNIKWDNPKLVTDFSRVAGRLDSEFGLVSAYHTWFEEAFGSESRPTHYFWRQRARPFHIDFCFIPRSMVPSLTSVAVLDAPPWDALSDHRPLVIDVDL